MKLPKQPKITRKEARELVKKSSDDIKAFHSSIRNGTWKPISNVDIIGDIK